MHSLYTDITDERNRPVQFCSYLFSFLISLKTKQKNEIKRSWDMIRHEAASPSWRIRQIQWRRLPSYSAKCGSLIPVNTLAHRPTLIRHLSPFTSSKVFKHFSFHLKKKKKKIYKNLIFKYIQLIEKNQIKSNNHQVKDQLLCRATEAYHLIIIRSIRFYFRSTSSYPAGLIIVSSLGSRDHSTTNRRCDHFLQLWW